MHPQSFPLPPGPIGFAFKHFWAVFILVTLVKAAVEWKRSVEPRLIRKPELEGEYRALYRGFLFWLNVPWLLMGVGILSGRVASVHEYLRPGVGNAAVNLWWLAMVGVLVRGSFWMFNGGAEKLEAFPGLPYAPTSTAKRIKLMWIGVCAWNIGFGALFWVGFPFGAASQGHGPSSVFPFLFPVFFIAMWLGVGFLLGLLSGWATLADSYPQDPLYRGPLVSASGHIGSVSYRGIVRVGADEKGLHLSVMFLFRVGHRPLTIPWDAIRVSRSKSFFADLAHFEVGNVTLALRTKDVLRLGKKRPLPSALSLLEARSPK